MIDCELDSCIHNKNFTCRYESVLINGYGMCDECMLVEIDKEELEKRKEKQLHALLERTKDW